MDFILNKCYDNDKLESFEARLKQLTTNTLMSEHQLNIWTNKIIDFRALQMDEAIEYDTDMNDLMDLFEDHIVNYRQMLRGIKEKVFSANEAMLFQHHTSNIITSSSIIHAFNNKARQQLVATTSTKASILKFD